jgi:hypothetical protein
MTDPEPAQDDGCEWLNSDQVRKLLGLDSRATLDSWARQRKGPSFYRIGGKRLYRPGEVRQWIEHQRVDCNPANARYAAKKAAQ